MEKNDVFYTCYKHTWEGSKVTTEEVEAIPIDWIHDYLDYTFLPESHFWVIQKMIKEWDKEHEKDI